MLYRCGLYDVEAHDRREASDLETPRRPTQKPMWGEVFIEALDEPSFQLHYNGSCCACVRLTVERTPVKLQGVLLSNSLAS